jgi:hypothetical protein
VPPVRTRPPHGSPRPDPSAPLPLSNHPPSFAILSRKDPEAAAELHHELDDAIHLRQERLQRRAADSKPAPKPAAEQPPKPAAE